MRQCGTCGALIEDKSRFCPECGVELKRFVLDVYSWDLLEVMEQINYFTIGVNEGTKKGLRVASLILFLGVLSIIAYQGTM